MGITSADTLSALADVQTIGQLRAALGVITDYLGQGYALLPSVSTSQGLQDEAKGLLDDRNADAKAIYERQPTDIPAQNFAVDLNDAVRLGLLASQTEDALRLVQEAVGVSEFHLGAALKQAVAEVKQNVNDAAESVGATAGAAAAAPLKGLLAALVAFLDGAKTVLVIAGVGAIVYYNRRPLLAAFAKGAK